MGRIFWALTSALRPCVKGSSKTAVPPDEVLPGLARRPGLTCFDISLLLECSLNLSCLRQAAGRKIHRSLGV